jgi:YD repeat-containing protein
MIDVDGDGYVDELDTNGSSTSWTVYYGNGIVYSDGTSEKAPSGWAAAQVSNALNADQVELDTEEDSWGHEEYVETDFDAVDVERALIDLNGDGWLDAYDPVSGQACYHGDERGDGWENCKTIDTFESIRSVTYTIYAKDEDGYAGSCWATCKYGCAIDNSCLDYVNEAEEYSSQCGFLTFWECFEAIEEQPCSDSFNSCYETCRESFCDEPRNAAFSTTSDDADGYQHFIEKTKITQGFYDLNGDGLPDHIDASDTPWMVALNNTHGFADPVEWASPKKYTSRTNEGEPRKTKKTPKGGFSGNAADIEDLDESDGNDDDIVTTLEEDGEAAATYQDLIDVDGDGLLDLALGVDMGDKWYKNTGSGFETSSRSLPGWWPDNFTTKVTHVTYGSGRATETVNAIISMMTDLDHDGAVDRVTACVDTDGDDPSPPSINCNVQYGPYPPPYKLVKVRNDQGGTTEVSYRSSATVEPSGDRMQLQYNPITKHLVDVTTSTDALTSQSDKTRYEYEDGYYEDGVFQGFAAREVTQEINGVETNTMSYDYDLDRDFEPLATSQELKTDTNLAFAPSLSRGAPTMGTRSVITNAYEDYGTAEAFHLVKTRVVKEYGEASGYKTVTHSYTWDDYGNLKTYMNDGGGTSDDAVTVNMSYAADAATTFYRLATKMVSGTDPLDGVTRAVEYTRYYYDGNSSPTSTLTQGLLSKRQTSGGWPLGGESLDADVLEITFERGSRGELESATDQSTGMKIEQTFDFGGAVVATQTNDLGQRITHTVDEEGRVTSVRDDNGLTVTNTYDSFGRVTKKQITDRDGEILTDTLNTYSRNGMPYYVKTVSYDEHGATDSTSYAVEDGFGRAAQAWIQDEDGHYLVTDSIFDLRGLKVTDSHPRDVGTAFTAPSSVSVASVLGKTYYDALGIARETLRDSAAVSGSNLVTLDSAGVEVRQDEEEYQTRLTYDAFHRVNKVEQGKAGSYVTTAQYRYDPLNRLVKYQDGGGTCYGYFYDGAGRLRQVKYGKPANVNLSTNKGSSASKASSTLSKSQNAFALPSSSCTPSQLWYTYEYDGAFKTKMTDASGAYASWTYDEIGRPESLTLSDSLPDSSGTLSYAWDYDDAWVGAVYKETDPAGEVTYSYDALGRVKDATRVYPTDSSGTTSASFSYAFDLRGRLLSKTLPSGRIISSDYDYGLLAKTTAATSGTTDYTIAYDYNDWGLLSTATSSLGHVYSNTYTTPLWVNKNSIKYGLTAYDRSYTWLKNGLLSKRTVSTDASAGSSTFPSSASSGGALGSLGTGKSSGAAALSTTYSYSYDALKELSQIKTPAKTFETYSYDAAGNLKTMKDASGVSWTYASAGALNQISKRTPTSGGVETYSYDDAGRVSEWKTANGTYAYYYDGLGRLRGVTLGGVWQMVLDYDVNGKITRRADSNPNESSPYYAYAFDDWRYDGKTGVKTELDTPLVATDNGTRRWLFREYDSSPVLAFSDSGTKTMSRVLGGYGTVWSSTGTTWDWNSFHGTEEQGELLHMGERHLMQKDGQWLQPEPMLYLGLDEKNLDEPLAFATYRYARNAPTAYQDRNGMTPLDFTTANNYVAFHPDVDLTPGPSSAAYSYMNANSVKGDVNCVAVTIAGIFNYLGVATEAKKTGMNSPSVIPKIFGGGEWQSKSLTEIKSELSQSGDGAVGAILIKYTKGDKTISHTVYATNDQNGLLIHDDQAQEVYTFGQAESNLGNKKNVRTFYYALPDDYECADPSASTLNPNATNFGIY